MATLTPRQPFGILDESRLSNLTSLKNRQNALQTLSPPTKRKAQTYDASNDSENIDPSLFSPKRSKSSNSSPSEYIKPANFYLTRAPLQSIQHATPAPIKSRPILSARSPVRRIAVDTTRTTTSSHSAPAGRSPTRKRVGILSRRRTARVDPPAFALSSNSTATGLGFSIAAALSSTAPSYTPKPRAAVPAPQMSIDEGAKAGVLPTLWSGGESKDSWFFDIHEDTAAEEAHNLMEHGACTLDLSSDEETNIREKNERGKENVPPVDDVSQTRAQETSSVRESASGMSATELAKAAKGKRRALQEGEIEIDRCPLGDLAAEEFYAEGCDDKSVFVVVEDAPVEDEAAASSSEKAYLPTPEEALAGEVPLPEVLEDEVVEEEIDIDALMQKTSEPAAPEAELLQRLQKSEGPGFEVWESGSEKGDE